MNVKEELQNQRWLIGVSGGADSMALLSMCVEANLEVIVAHMNYQKRDSANRDMQGVQAYCEQHNITCIIKYQEKICVGNFQAFARKERYRFYHEVIEAYQLAGVLIAHHFDDHLETYLMQKQRHSLPEYYGIQADTRICDCHVVRPLLTYTKEELERYCIDHNVPYYMDESNLSDAYTRNRIRHHELAQMTKEEKKHLGREIEGKNKELQQLHKQAEDFISTWKQDANSLYELPEAVFQMAMRRWLHIHKVHNISDKELHMIYSLSPKSSWVRPMRTQISLRNSYGVLSIDREEDESYAYVYDTLTYETTPYFQCAKEGSSVEALTLHKEDFPITIRSCLPHDAIALRFGTKKLNRWFIDRKIPKEMRKTWPVVVNAQGKIILVPKIGCDISHFSNNPNLFVIK